MASFGRPAAAAASASAPAGVARRWRRWRPRAAGVVALVGVAFAAAAAGSAVAAAAAVASEPAVAAPAGGAAPLVMDAVRDVFSEAAAAPAAAAAVTEAAPVGGLASTASVRVACPPNRCMRLGQFRSTVSKWRRTVRKRRTVKATEAQADRFKRLAWSLSSARTCGKTVFRCFRGDTPERVLSKAMANAVLRPRLPGPAAGVRGAPRPGTDHKSRGGVYVCERCSRYYFPWGSSCCYEGCPSMNSLGGSAAFISESCCATLGPQCDVWRWVETNQYYWGGF